MRKNPFEKKIRGLACGLLQDGERALFLCRKDGNGAETLEVPCARLFGGENPVALLSQEFRRMTGIDAEVHEILFEKRHNAGSRKRKEWVPVLVFRLTSKGTAVNIAPEYSGCRWLAPKDLKGRRLDRNSMWLC